MKVRALWLAFATGMLAACSSTTSLTDAELSQAAKQGDGRAQYELAKRLATQPDYPNAMHWMQQAAEQSGPLVADQQVRANAAWQVGGWYQAGLGEPKNLLLANQWWQRSALTAKDLWYKLLKIGVASLFEQDSHVQNSIAQTLGPGDVQLVISYSGSSRGVLAASRAGQAQWRDPDCHHLVSANPAASDGRHGAG